MKKAIFPGRAFKRLAAEPLVHFLVLGCVMFGAYAVIQRGEKSEPPPTEINLTVDDLSQLLMIFEAKWRRQPTQDEFNALVEDRIRQDVLYREALRLGLDQEDTIVKRRMAQKMQFLAEDVAAAKEPTDTELREWFASNSKMFAMPARLSFRHLYFSPDVRGSRAKEDAARTLSKLAGQPLGAGTAGKLADRFMFQDYYADRTPQAIARDFGPEFAQALGTVEPGSWQGPVKSGFGWHLVYLEPVVPGRIPSFEEVRKDVKTAWLGKQKELAWQAAYKEIRARYTVRLPVPASGAVPDLSGEIPVSDNRAADSGDTM